MSGKPRWRKPHAALLACVLTLQGCGSTAVEAAGAAGAPLASVGVAGATTQGGRGGGGFAGSNADAGSVAMGNGGVASNGGLAGTASGVGGGGAGTGSSSASAGASGAGFASTGGASGAPAIGGEAGNTPADGGATATGGSDSGGTGSTAGSGGVATGGASVSSGGMAGGGSGGSPGYQPCPTNGEPCKVLPFGDSITWGVGDEGNGGYRGPLFASAVADGKNIAFTGSLTNGPSTVSGQTFPQRNEGHSGWGISQVTQYSGGNAGIATVLPSPAFSSGSGGLPHIILLHIGTNDQGSFSASQMTSDLSGLLDKIITNAPDAYVVVAQIIPLGYGTNDVIKTYNQSIPGLVQQLASAGKHITLVDMFTGFTASSMLDSDNIHPNSAGYEFMADHWYSIIGPLLPQ